jgi:hypothetical protein
MQNAYSIIKSFTYLIENSFDCKRNIHCCSFDHRAASGGIRWAVESVGDSIDIISNIGRAI